MKNLKIIIKLLIIYNIDLKSLFIRNLKKIVVGHLNIRLETSSFFLLIILIISGIKLDESFHTGQFLLDGCKVPFRCDRSMNGGGILLYFDIPSKLLSRNKNIDGFFVEINLRNKKK